MPERPEQQFQAREIDGEVWISKASVIDALRQFGSECSNRAEGQGPRRRAQLEVAALAHFYAADRVEAVDV